MAAELELSVWNESQGAVPISCRDFVEAHTQGALGWRPDLDSSALPVKGSGHDAAYADWNLGEFHLVLRQLKDVAIRLQRPELAILRSAVLDQPTPPYYLFVPEGRSGLQTVSLSMVFINDSKVGSCFPVETGLKGEVKTLFRHVQKNLPQLLASGRSESVVFERGPLLEGLRTQIEWGEELLKILDAE